MKTAAKTLLVLLLMGAAVGAGNAQTQQEKQSPKPKATQQPSGNYENLPEPDITKSGKRSKILLDQIDVVGRLSKPQAIFILPGSDPRVDGLKIDRSFLDDIFRPVEKDFFPQKGKRKFRGTIPW
ncbi:MAG: hypothetical protein DWQ05_01140 [Calditrichaeota bacterium]|nr:MAG: hypothetical protein DWQ05_01140 [Calditrichota bacterium]